MATEYVVNGAVYLIREARDYGGSCIVLLVYFTLYGHFHCGICWREVRTFSCIWLPSSVRTEIEFRWHSQHRHYELFSATIVLWNGMKVLEIMYKLILKQLQLSGAAEGGGVASSFLDSDPRL